MFNFNTMNIESQKFNIIRMIINSDDHDFIASLQHFCREQTADWYEDLNSDQQREVLEGLSDTERKNFIPHSKVEKVLGKWSLKG